MLTRHGSFITGKKEVRYIQGEGMKNLELRKLKLDKVYLRSFFFAVFAAELIVAFLLLILFGSIQTNSAQNYSIAQLEQVCTELDMLYDSLESVSYQILADRDTYPSFSGKSTGCERRIAAGKCGVVL